MGTNWERNFSGVLCAARHSISCSWVHRAPPLPRIATPVFAEGEHLSFLPQLLPSCSDLVLWQRCSLPEDPSILQATTLARQQDGTETFPPSTPGVKVLPALWIFQRAWRILVGPWQAGGSRSAGAYERGPTSSELHPRQPGCRHIPFFPSLPPSFSLSL